LFTKNLDEKFARNFEVIMARNGVERGIFLLETCFDGIIVIMNHE
jgi:hypothetical protein